jgi:hypothetical protein
VTGSHTCFEEFNGTGVFLEQDTNKLVGGQGCAGTQFCLKTTVFWDVPPCSLVDVSKLPAALMMQTASISETSVSYQTTWCNNPEDNHRHTRLCENLKSRKLVRTPSVRVRVRVRVSIGPTVVPSRTRYFVLVSYTTAVARLAGYANAREEPKGTASRSVRCRTFTGKRKLLLCAVPLCTKCWKMTGHISSNRGISRF